MDNLMTLEELYQYGITLMSCGFILGCIPMVIGIAIEGLMNIFKKV